MRVGYYNHKVFIISKIQYHNINPLTLTHKHFDSNSGILCIESNSEVCTCHTT